MNLRQRLHLPLLALSLPGLPSVSAAAAPLRIAFDAGSPPTQYAGPGGEAAGIYPALVRQAFTSMGEPAEWVAEPFRRVVVGLLAGATAAGASVRNEERLAASDFSRDYFLEQLRVYRIAGGGALQSGIEGLHGRRVGVVRGWSYGDAFDKARAAGLFVAEEVESDLKNFAKLRAGRVNAVVATELAARMLLDGPAQDQPAGASITGEAQPLLSIGIALAVPRALGAQALLRRFDAAIATMKHNGVLEAIVSAEVERARALMPSPRT